MDEWLRRLGTSLMKQPSHCYLVKDMKELLPCIHCSMDSSLKPQLYKFQSDLNYSIQLLHIVVVFFCFF